MSLTADSPAHSPSTSCEDFAAFLDAELDSASDTSPNRKGDEEEVVKEAEKEDDVNDYDLDCER